MISVNNVSKLYGDFRAVNDISFVIRRGEITGLLGPNGAGKTTTLRMLTCYLPPDAGKISVGDHPVDREPLEVKRMIGYLPESAPLYADMMVRDYLAYVGRLRGVGDDSRLRDVAAMCGIGEVMHKNIGELSKGYRQRVGLAHAMMHDPEILILDEPTSGLDPNQIVEIRKLIKEIGKKKTVILSTHILSEVEATCDRVIIIDHGRIVADSRTAELKAAAGARCASRSGRRAPTFRNWPRGLPVCPACIRSNRSTMPRSGGRGRSRRGRGRHTACRLCRAARRGLGYLRDGDRARDAGTRIPPAYQGR
jgi:ABC-2 type transport system ATP-binding protein